ncbi:very short patch repair endonuclease [bacterium]|nr:very short patch repair endonuclease [bacterium]
MKHQKLSTTREISKRMANVHLKAGKAEVTLAKKLWKKGIRYRKNYKKLPGSPDIAILKYHIAVFVDGEFWHGKDWDQKKTRLKSNQGYWIEKIEENITRDKRNDLLLSEMGWKPIHFWEKDVNRNLESCIALILKNIYTSAEWKL